MASNIEAKREGECVTISVQVGDKRARFRVTPDYARALAAELLSAADGSTTSADELRALGDKLRGATRRGRIEDMLRGVVDAAIRDKKGPFG